jgi:hypothetical protein
MLKLRVLLTGVCFCGFLAHPQTYRVAGKTRVKIVDSTGFYVYSVNKLVQGEKIARPEDMYYFSVDADGPLLELTKGNLEKAFASNAKFRYALEAQFRSDKQLMEYDRYGKVYKLKYLYTQSLK